MISFTFSFVLVCQANALSQLSRENRRRGNIATIVPSLDDNLYCPSTYVKPPSLESIADSLKSGPIRATSDSLAKRRKGRQHLFITGGAYTGTTGVLGLVSTSPVGTNLCASRTVCCEGSWLLDNLTIKKGADGRGDPDYPEDWKQVLPIFDSYWNHSKTVFIDKSPSYLFKFTHLYKDLKPTGIQMSFMYVIRSPCMGSNINGNFKDWTESMEKVVQEITDLRAAGARVHIVRAEEILGDPIGVTQGILEFMPELIGLDPNKSGVHDAPYVRDGDARAMSVVNFTQRSGPKRFVGTKVKLTPRDGELMEFVGYTKDWFRSSFVHDAEPQPSALLQDDTDWLL